MRELKSTGTISELEWGAKKETERDDEKDIQEKNPRRERMEFYEEYRPDATKQKNATERILNESNEWGGSSTHCAGCDDDGGGGECSNMHVYVGWPLDDLDRPKRKDDQRE